MKENLSNSKNNKAKLYKALSIAGVSTLIGGGLIGIGASVANIITTKEKNLGTDYGQGLNFNLQFSLNDPAFANNNVQGMIEKLQKTANALSSKLYKLGLKQIKLTPKIARSESIKNNNLNVDAKNVYGLIDINVDSQEGTRWYLNPKIQELFEKLNKTSSKEEQKSIFDDYVNKNYPKDDPYASKTAIKDLANNVANKLAIYFATESVGKVSLASNLNQPILNNTNNIEFQNIDTSSKTGISQKENYKNQLNAQNAAYKEVNNNEKNTKLVETSNNDKKDINFEVLLSELSKINWRPVSSTESSSATITTKSQYLNLSGFTSQFNDVYKWKEHNQDKPTKEQWKTHQEAVDAKKTEDGENYEKNLLAPQATWVLWTNRSGLLTRLNYLSLLAYTSTKLTNLSGPTLEYWTNLVGDENTTYKQYKSDTKKPINGLLIKQITDNDTEETKFYYWVKQQILSGVTLNHYMLNFDYLTQNQTSNLTTSNADQLMLLLNDFYSSNVFDEATTPEEPTPEQPSSSPETPATYISSTSKKTNFEWIRSWMWSKHDLISPYGTAIDYANFYQYFDIAKLDDVFGKKELQNYNKQYASDDSKSPNYIDQYNSAFTNKIKYNTNQKTISDAQNLIDDYGSYSYGNDIINLGILNNSRVIAQPGITNEQVLNSFGSFINSFATLSTASLPKSAIGLDAWTSTIIGISVVILIIGIIISILYRVPGAFATITTFLVAALSLVAYRSLNLTFSFDTSVALLAGVFISFITIVNFLTFIPRLLKDKNLNLKFGIIRSFKYFIRNSIGIHVTALIIALVFLYFGQFQIQGFGSMLVINMLMSLLFNVGVFIGFISILSFGLLMYKPSLMFDKEISDHIINIELTGFDNSSSLEIKPWILKFSNNVLFNKIWLWVIGSIVGLLSIIGVVLLVVGVGQNGLIESDTFKILVLNPNVIPTLNDLHISVSNNVAMVSGDVLNNVQILTLINNGSIQVVQNNNYIASMVVKSLVDTCLIAMGFCLIWSLLWLNFVNIIGVFVVQLVSLLTFGLLGIFQLPIDINMIIVISLGFLINNVMIYSNFINLKFGYQMKSNWNEAEIKDYVLKNQRENIALYLVQYFVVACCLLVLMLFISTKTIAANALIVLNCIFNIVVIYVLIPYLFMGMMMAREKYVVKSMNHKKQANHFDYDKVDEQDIIGINKHVYNPL